MWTPSCNWNFEISLHSLHPEFTISLTYITVYNNVHPFFAFYFCLVSKEWEMISHVFLTRTCLHIVCVHCIVRCEILNKFWKVWDFLPMKLAHCQSAMQNLPDMARKTFMEIESLLRLNLDRKQLLGEIISSLPLVQVSVHINILYMAFTIFYCQFHKSPTS